MEAIVSLLILGILMTSIVGVIRFSLVMTGNATRDATLAQEIINDFKLAPTGGTPGEMRFQFQVAGTTVVATHNIRVFEDDVYNFVAFHPE